MNHDPTTGFHAVSVKQIEGGKMTLLPAAPGLCPECATKHEPESPHNAQSLFYQVKFQMEYDRGATWVDAMAHCSDDIKTVWTRLLVARGVDVEGGKIAPDPKLTNHLSSATESS
jgi:hypothetical protein